ncbi:MAG TPA: peptidyl-prolyl cis-trans isomerase, partial [Gemmatimonadota bacterium]|nr:peptidyl-prolyl cis-trans isomerase [Gemmatimonadota bacterium]
MKLLREPLLHFVAIGAVLFLVHALASGLFQTDTSRRIEITEAEIELLASTWQRQWMRPPTEQELRSLVRGRLREEILYREALAVGLDQNDAVVRRRMVQKM